MLPTRSGMLWPTTPRRSPRSRPSSPVPTGRSDDDAASRYTRTHAPGEGRWFPAALDLLADAGADRDRAASIAAARVDGGLSGLGEQAAPS